MRYRALLFLSSLLLLFSCQKGSDEVRLDIIHTTDLHGHIFPYDFITDTPAEGSFSRVAQYVDSLRQLPSRSVVLLDGGDLLQGQPSAYHYNFIDTTSTHLIARVMNWMKYDALTIGNHDIEAGHPVYDRFVQELEFPALSANIRDASTGEPYFQPYTIVEKGGIKVAILGLTTPDLVEQLPEVLWSGLTFEDQLAVAKEMLPEIQSHNPDIIIALIHSGAGPKEGDYRPFSGNVAYHLAKAVPELDVVLNGHDHRMALDSVVHENGEKTLLLNAGNDGKALGHIQVRKDKDGNLTLHPSLVLLDQTPPSAAFLEAFAEEQAEVKEFVNIPVGEITAPLDARTAYFGPSTFIDLIHQLQFSVFPEAEISITAPLVETGTVPAGTIYMRNLFMLYKYENMLYLMEFTGDEVKGLLEESYDRWINTISSPSDRLLRIDESKLGGQYLPFERPTFNFDTASGLTYTVDVRHPRGTRVNITKVGDAPFQPSRTYKVAVNSYRGNGGGGLLTEEGAGIPARELRSRLLQSTERNLRWYLMGFFQDRSPYTPHITSDWSFIPEEWTEPALERDSVLLFSHH